MMLMFVISSYHVVAFIRLELDDNKDTCCDDINNQAIDIYYTVSPSMSIPNFIQ